MKIHSVVAELFHVDGRTDRQPDTTKLKVTFLNFVNVPENQHIYFNLPVLSYFFKSGVLKVTVFSSTLLCATNDIIHCSLQHLFRNFPFLILNKYRIYL
jgi:hypothetical protein